MKRLLITSAVFTVLTLILMSVAEAALRSWNEDVDSNGTVNVVDVFRTAKVAFGMAEPSAVEVTAVREQNIDADGFIKVHEQGVVDVNVVSHAAGRLIELGTVTVSTAGHVQEYPMVDVSDCVETMVMAQQTSEPPEPPGQIDYIALGTGFESPNGIRRISSILAAASSGQVDGFSTTSGSFPGRHRYVQFGVRAATQGYVGTVDIAAWIWCAR